MDNITIIHMGNERAESYFQGSGLPDSWRSAVRAEATYTQNMTGGIWSDAVWYACKALAGTPQPTSPTAARILADLGVTL